MPKLEGSSTPEEDSIDVEADQEPPSSMDDHAENRSVARAAGEAAERALGVPEALVGDPAEERP